MLILILLCMIKTHSYSFCPNCLNCKRTDSCDLLQMHPLFKDRPDIDFMGKEICSEKGKYFISSLKTENNSMTRHIKEQNTNIFKGNFRKTK